MDPHLTTIAKECFDAHTTLNQHLPTHFNTYKCYPGKFWYCRLSPNHKIFHFGDCDENARPSVEQLPNKGEWVLAEGFVFSTQPSVRGVILLVHDRDVARTILVRFVQLNMTKLTQD